jgi:hypothetical protein
VKWYSKFAHDSRSVNYNDDKSTPSPFRSYAVFFLSYIYLKRGIFLIFYGSLLFPFLRVALSFSYTCAQPHILKIFPFIRLLSY